jgi:hypothetical protein
MMFGPTRAAPLLDGDASSAAAWSEASASSIDHRSFLGCSCAGGPAAMITTFFECLEAVTRAVDPCGSREHA